ncbi:MAG TPA: lytic transglycosylase domain-containing protein [Anaerolineaceae bacterium]|nr:lytic transglycosylase domain-containing protein [Anaerolineaceae bacterium]
MSYIVFMQAPVRFLFPAIIFASLVIVFATRLVSAEIAVPVKHDAGLSGEDGEVFAVNTSIEQFETKGCELSAQFSVEIKQWCSMITSTSYAAGLDPNLVAAVIQIESAGNPDAYSNSGAVGLMQVMPRDGLAANFHCINGPCFASRPAMAELFDPAFNISYGTAMLSSLVNKNQNLRDGLYAYGPAGVGYSYADAVLQVYQSSIGP